MIDPNDPKLWKNIDWDEPQVPALLKKSDRQVNAARGVRLMWQRDDIRKNHKTAVQKNAIPKDLIIKIFTEFHNPNRQVDDISYKEILSKTYGITLAHINKICMARSNYIRECLGLTDNEINEIKQRYLDSKPKYRIKTFGIDVIDLYKDYSYKSKFPVKLVWEVRFGKYKGLKRKQLEQALGISLTRDDADSFKKSYSWLTNSNSKELFYGNFMDALKFVKVLPTRQEKFAFIKTGKYQGCYISYE
jgi:hypothetical protein